MKRWLSLAVVAGLVFAACGGAEEATEGVASLEDVTEETSVTTTTIEFDQEQAVLDLVECLRAEGLDVVDPEIDSEGNVNMLRWLRRLEEQGLDQADVEGAIDGCADLIENVRLGFTRDLDFTALQDQLLVFAECMRENGYDMPDPDFSSFGQGGPGQGGPPGPGAGPFGEIDPEDPDFQAALEQCEDTLPGFGPGGRGGPGGGRP